MLDSTIYKLVGDVAVMGSKQYQDSLEKINSVHLRLKVLEGILTSRRKSLKLVWLLIWSPARLNRWMISELTDQVEAAKKRSEAIRAEIEKQQQEAKDAVEKAKAEVKTEASVKPKLEVVQ